MLISNEWDLIIDNIFGLEMINNLIGIIDSQRYTKKIYPDKEDVFKAFRLTSFEDIKVVIIGQDPYYNEGQADGLAFSVKKGVKTPPSLKNIFKELVDNTGISYPTSGDLSNWAKQGVLLLNSTLTVEDKKPNSHVNYPWSIFTDSIIKYISDYKSNVVFILWGNFAIKKSQLIDSNKHLILQSSHPSPLSARHSFLGSKVFSKCNLYLEKCGVEKIDWSLQWL